MANEMTAATGLELQMNEVILEAVHAYREEALHMIPSFCRYADLTGLKTTTAEFPILGGATCAAANEAADQDPGGGITQTSVTLSVARKGTREDVTDLLMDSAVVNMNQAVGYALGLARAEGIDTDVLSVMTTNFTTVSGATDSSVMSSELIMAGIMTLQVAKAFKPGKVNVALHPKQYILVADDLVFTTNSQTDVSSVGNAAVNNYLIGSAMGCKFYVSANVPTGTNTNSIYRAMMWEQNAIGLAVKDIPPSIKLQTDISKALTEFVITYYDSAGIITPTGVCALRSSTY